MINPTEALKHDMTGDWQGVVAKYAKLSGYKKALDIGTASGLSAWSIAQNGIGEITSLDIKGQKDARRLSKEYKYDDRIEFITEKSQDYFDRVDDMFELIIVDGSHKKPDVYEDAVKGWKHLKVGGYMVFDDYNHLRLKSDVGPSVRQLAQEVGHKVWEEKDKAIIHKKYE